jgi:hypothetical protein
MDSLQKIIPSSPKEWAYLTIAGLSLTAAVYWHKKFSAHQKYSNLEPKDSMLDLIGNTPIIF